ncbi:peroxidase 3 [Quercus suber]|uniref:peroxidase n=1 Tax=Quercus suber TaxID=58331 RepID=A0AAW0M9V5_QUESU
MTPSDLESDEEVRMKTTACDALILIDSTANNTAKKDAVPNQTLGGFDYKKLLWKVFLGRRGGTISHASDALANLPPPTFNFDQLKQRFASKDLDIFDLVNNVNFAHSIKKMGEIQVLTGTEGQIRKKCSVVNLVYE